MSYQGPASKHTTVHWPRHCQRIPSKQNWHPKPAQHDFSVFCCCRFSVNQKSVFLEMSAFFLPFNFFDSELYLTLMFYGSVTTFLSSWTFTSLYELCGRYTSWYSLVCALLSSIFVFPPKQHKIHNLNINAQRTSLCHRQNLTSG